MDALTSAAMISNAKRIVIKIGSALLVDSDSSKLRHDWLQALAEDVAALKRDGKDVIIVSSGSIALGRAVLKLPAGALSLEQAQAAAAVGQIRLARAYQEILSPFEIETAQILVTLEDSENRRRYLNSRATIGTLLELNVVPIVNENDTVATDEIRFGDNDRLGAQVASMAGADVLVLLSDVDGLYTDNPRINKDAKHLDIVEEITADIESMAGDAGSTFSRGGMRTKIMAAKAAMHAGCAMAIARGDVLHPIQALQNGAKCTWFRASGAPGLARKRWISGMKSKGKIIVDQGAATALQRGNSLLPAGVKSVEGKFARGEAVDIVTTDGTSVTRAITGYSADEAAKIAGCQSSEIETKLGHPGRAVMVHRDDMAL